MDLRLPLAVVLLTGCAEHHRVESFERVDASRLDATAHDAAVDAFTPPPRCAMRRVANLQVGSASYARYSPDLVFDGDAFQVIATESDPHEHPWVSVTTVSRDLRDVGPTRFAGEETHGWALGSLLSDGAIALAWNGDPGGPSRVLYRRLEGEERTARIDLVDTNSEAVLDLVTVGDTSLVGYRYRVDVDGELMIESRSHLIDRHGTALSEPTTWHVAEYPGRTIRMSVMGNEFLAALPHDDTIEVRRIDVDGNVLDVLHLDAPDVRHVVIASDPERMALAWRSGPADARNIVFQAFDASFRPLGAPRELESAAPGTSVPAIAAMPSGWAVLFGEGRYNDRSVLLNLDPTGEPFEPRHELVGTLASSYGAPAIEVVDGELFLAVAHAPEEGRAETIFVQRWVCDAEPDLCREQAIPRDGCDETFLGWEWTGSACAPVFGCACEGGDCAMLARTEHACLHDHAGCEAATCLEAEPTQATSLCIDARQHNAYSHPSVWARVPGTECCTTCRASAVAPYVIELALERCIPDRICDCAGDPRGVECRLPPMGAGDWIVRNGTHELTLQVVPRWESLEPPEPACSGT